jgi:D-hydroxyproline dehydrogenase subunit alpha
MDSAISLNFDVAVVGAGPAGVAAAVTAAESGKSVALIDDNPRPGGQIWRGGPGASVPSEAARWLELLAKSRVQVIGGARVFYADGDSLHAETDRSLLQMRYRKLILATGARELFLPFPGWTLPNVVGAGGLQALGKSGLPVAGKRVVVAGTGPLLLAVAAYLRQHGANVMCVCEQASRWRLARFLFATLRFPEKVFQAMRLRRQSGSAAYLPGAWVVAALGKDRVEAVCVAQGGVTREIPCDYLACGYHLVPNLELAQMLKCRSNEGFVAVDEYQLTSQPQIYCAGEPTSIGGVELSLLEGRIAGFAAVDNRAEARRLFSARARYQRLARAMKNAFRLRPELATLAKPETLLCRCEDVCFERVQRHDSWKSAKLHTRCGMGPCQGRVCGSAAAFLFCWNVESFRPPVFAARCSSLAAASSSDHAPQTGGGSQ